MILENPYSDVDFGAVVHERAETHMHANHDGGRTDAHVMLDEYDDADYGAVAIASAPAATDFDKTQWSWPWMELSEIEGEDYEDRYPLGHHDETEDDDERVDMHAIKGIESTISDTNHITYYFADEYYNLDEDQSVKTRLEKMMDDGGLASISHPEFHGVSGANWEEYRDYYQEFDDLRLEVVGRASPDSVNLWDQLLTYFAPERTIYGHGADDGKATSHVDEFSDTLLVDSLTEQNVESAYRNGGWYFSDNGSDGSRPRLTDVSVSGSTITISADDHDQIRWISGGFLVGTGPSYDVSEGNFGYVRAEIHGNSTTYTQPFLTEENTNPWHTKIGDTTLGSIDIS